VNDNFISDIENSIVEYIDMYNLIPGLVSQGKNMAAIEMAGFIDNEIMGVYEVLTSIYSKVFDRFKVLQLTNSKAIGNLKSKKILSDKFFSLAPGLHKSWGMYFYSGDPIADEETKEKFSNRCKIVLGNFNSKYDLPMYSDVPELVMQEIEYLIFVLSDIVEPGWPEFEQQEGQEQKPNRYISREVKLQIWRRDQGKCCDCGSKEKLEYDHIIPVSRGGSNTERNIQLLCERCNRSKSSKIA